MNRRRIVSTIVVGVLALSAIVLGGWQARAHSNVAPSAAPHYLPPGGEVGKGEQFAAMDTYWNDRLTYPTGHFNPAWLRAAKRQDARIASRRPGDAPDLGTWTALGPQPERMTGCTGCYDYGFTEGRVNEIVVDPTTTTSGLDRRLPGRGRRRCLEDDELLQQLDHLGLDDRRPPHLHARDRHPHHRPERPQHDLRGNGRPELRLLLDGQPGHPQVDGRRSSLDDPRRGRVRPGVHRAGRPVPAVRRGRQGASRPEREPEGHRRNEEGHLRLVQRRDGLDGAVLDERLPDPAPGHHRARAVRHGRGHTDRRRGRRARLRDDRPVRPREQRRQRALQREHASDERLPELQLDRLERERLRLRQRDLGEPVYDGRADERGQRRRRIRTRPRATSSAGSTSRSPRATRRSSMRRCSRSPRTAGIAAARPAVSSASGRRTTAGARGRTCRARRAPRSAAAASTMPQNWYDQGLEVDPNNADRLFIDTYDVWFATRTGTSLTDLTCGYNGSNGHVVHVDQHALAFVPGSSSILLIGSDGGAFSTSNADIAGSGTPTFVNMDDGLNTIEFYSGDISGYFATSPTPSAAGGAQDNAPSVVGFTGYPTGPKQWQMTIGGDGFYARIDPVGNALGPALFRRQQQRRHVSLHHRLGLPQRRRGLPVRDRGRGAATRGPSPSRSTCSTAGSPAATTALRPALRAAAATSSTARPASGSRSRAATPA